MEDIYVNMDEAKGVSSNHTGVRSSHRRFYPAAILCLGLLSVFLLVGLITLSVYYHRVGADLYNLTERLQTSDDKLSSMIEERDRLTANLTAMNIKLQCLTAQNKHCPAGWRLFGCGCYFFSADSASWERSRQNCREKGADLVAIDSYEEQVFLSESINKTYWIGLNDREQEGTWKWSDGTPLDSTLTYWARQSNQPDNGQGVPPVGEEDCVHLYARTKITGNWNDLGCRYSVQWICEKMAEME